MLAASNISLPIICEATIILIATIIAAIIKLIGIQYALKKSLSFFIVDFLHSTALKYGRNHA